MATTSEKATHDSVIQHRDLSNWSGRRSRIAGESRLRFKLTLALLGLVSFIWFTRIDFRFWFLGSPSFKQIVRSELEHVQGSPTTISSADTRTVLECFQVAQPVLGPNGPISQSTVSNETKIAAEVSPNESCSVLLMDHVFGFSYGKPFVGNYTPPNCSFNRVIMNFTVVSEGRQFDRIALMYFGDTEIWRTSTAEPTQPPGIRWTFLKDTTEYLYFWKSPQKLIFDLGNLIDDKYTGSFNATLTATFFVADVEAGEAPADLIIPISTRKGVENGPSLFTLPVDNATNTIRLPRNVNRAVFSVSANGQASEEFWWSNVLQSDTLTFSETTGPLLGLSPFREVQVLIDGNIAGVQWPFPVIFTGGVVPSLHRPIVGLQAFDLSEHQIDISPWLHLLCDGAEHTFTIKVAGLNDISDSANATLTEAVNDSWYVTGKIFLWLDEDGSVTTGNGSTAEYLEPTVSLSHHVIQNATGFNETLVFNLVVERTISAKSTINSKNQTGERTWSQVLSYSNQAVVSNFGLNTVNNFTIVGVDSSTGPVNSYKAAYNYPLYCNQTYFRSPQGNLTISAHLVQGLEVQVEGNSIFPTGLEAFANVPPTRKTPYTTSHLKTHRDGTAFFFQTGDRKKSSGYGTTNQIFHFGGSSENPTVGAWGDVDELYFRNVTAANGTVVSDSERVGGIETYGFSRTNNHMEESFTLFAHIPDKARGPKSFIGKGADGNGMYRQPSVQVQISWNQPS
ncbi:hypothetical protein F4776DRAFT_653526 [Hypoxylon sp. NC0597]|nr:hypothetical protein F4776DRAFT_653526 [Hypoxylon sp. NC0597]